MQNFKKWTPHAALVFVTLALGALGFVVISERVSADVVAQIKPIPSAHTISFKAEPELEHVKSTDGFLTTSMGSQSK